MASWLDNTLARFDIDNGTLALQTGSLLERIVPDTQRHARFINTLSMLEHIGSHKIMSTQHAAGIDQQTLRHVAEEAHHAYFMKHQAEKTAQRAMEYCESDLLAPAAARMYFQRLEAAMVRTLERRRTSRAVYLYMSMIVEFRALWLYRLYQRMLKQHRHPMSLKRVLGEEQNHLLEMAQRLETGNELDSARAMQLLTCEQRLYARLLGAMQNAVAAA
jgi:hypothetical protein